MTYGVALLETSLVMTSTPRFLATAMTVLSVPKSTPTTLIVPVGLSLQCGWDWSVKMGWEAQEPQRVRSGQVSRMAQSKCSNWHACDVAFVM